MSIHEFFRRSAAVFSLVLLIVVCGGSTCFADVRLPGFFSNHMVLQQQKQIPVWGWAEPGESVTVTLGTNKAETSANAEGKWRVNFPAMEASEKAIQLKVSGNNELIVEDILVGEVWLCSGQSNMEWRVRQSVNPEEEIAAAKYPHIRHFKAEHRPSTVPLDDIVSDWQLCSPETVGDFTAAGYFMARHLHKELGVPIGIINSSWGGTRVEPWTPPTGFEQVEALEGIHRSVLQKKPGSKLNQQLTDQHLKATEEWLAKARESLKQGGAVEPSPAFPNELVSFKSHQDPTMLYNGMIHALVGFPIRGAVWYQGESNHSEGMLYFEKKKALIMGWRELWGVADFPFYFVQIAPFQYGNEDPTILAEFWEAQAAVLDIPKTGMVVINDIATLNNIHPPNKQDVGHRLALLALKNDYGRDSLVASGPTLKSLEVLDGKLKVNFSNTGGALRTRDGKTPDHFEIAGPGSNGFQPATAEIQGDSILLSAENVEAPTAMRFAWNKLAEPNLAGGTGLPCGAFRAGEMPEILDSVPDADKLQLVYELDLSELGSQTIFKVDNSSSVNKFSRIGYCLELESAQFGRQNLFVSMDAFTNDVSQIALPTVASKANFRQAVKSLDVYSDVKSIRSGTGLDSGYIEFWPNNYAPQNGNRVKGASASVYDFGDTPTEPVNGYGCMQVHNLKSKQTLFSINHWVQGAQADIGIGNSPGEHHDWTFTPNASSYSKKRLRIFVIE